ncbi:MAG: HAD family hydrolase [Pseudomonadota bacterium]
MTDALIEAVLFDKDGTLYAFAQTWNVVAAELVAHLAKGDDDHAERLADAIGFDRTALALHPDSIAVAGTNAEVAAALIAHLPEWDHAELAAFIAAWGHDAPLVEAVPLDSFLAGLAAHGLRLGVMTNDHESAARAHLTRSGVLEHFDFVAGADSGHGAKPDPAPLLAFAGAIGVAPGAVVMVGDSPHDLIAGRAAGMHTVGVLSGARTAPDLAPYSDVVLPDIGHLPGWLAGRLS